MTANPGLLTKQPASSSPASAASPAPAASAGAGKPVTVGVPAAVAIAIADWVRGQAGQQPVDIAAKVKDKRRSGLLVDITNHVAIRAPSGGRGRELAAFADRNLDDRDLADLCQVAASLSERRLLAPAEALVDAAWSVEANRRQPLTLSFGLMLVATQRPADALAPLMDSTAHKPQDATAWFNLALAHVYLAEYDKAWPAFRRSLELSPGNARIKSSYGLALLTAGRPEQAWPLYESRMALADQRKRHDQPTPMWHGEPFPGETLFVYGEQGFGDFIQFARYLPAVKALGGRVVVGCRGPLIALVSKMDGVDAVVKFDPGGKTPKHDLRVPVMSLAQYIDPRLERVGMDRPYLTVPPASGPPRPGKTPRIGLGWGCSPTGSGAAHKRVPTPALEPLIATAGVRWYSVQFEDSVNAELADVSFGSKISQSLAESMGDFVDNAAKLGALDLVITTDTVTAHLAGAMGLTAWVLLPCQADWRWGQTGDSTPWYPSLRLFRLERAGAWDALIVDVAAALEDWLVDWSPPRNRR